MDVFLSYALQSSFATVFRSRLVAAAVALLAAGATLHADPKADFRDAVYQYDRARTPADLQAVVVLLRRAIAQNSTESTTMNIRTEQSSVFLAYRPHAYLAAALARLGQCEEARQHLKAAEPAGEKNIDVKVLKLARDTCPQPPLIADSRPPVKPPVVTSTQPPPPPAVDPLASLKDDLKAKLSEAQGARGRQVSAPLTSRARDAQTALASAINAASSPPADAGAFRSIISRLADATKQYSDALDKLPPPAPPRLASALDAYANGDYRGTLQLLTGLNAPAPYDSQVPLVRAAAGYMQAALLGDKKPELRVQADLREYKRLAPRGATLDKHLFNPRFCEAVAKAQ